MADNMPSGSMATKGDFCNMKDPAFEVGLKNAGYTPVQGGPDGVTGKKPSVSDSGNPGSGQDWKNRMPGDNDKKLRR